MTNDALTSTQDEMLRLVTGCWVSRALYVVAKLGIADLLGEGPKSCSVLAGTTQTHAGSLYRVLRALASVGVFAEEQDQRFRLTALGEHLRTGMPGSLRAFAILLGEPPHWRAWEGILHSVSTGRPAFDQVFGVPLFRTWRHILPRPGFSTKP